MIPRPGDTGVVILSANTRIPHVAAVLFQPAALTYSPDLMAHFVEYRNRCREWLKQCVLSFAPNQVDLSEAARCTILRSASLPGRYGRLRVVLILRYGEYASDLDGGILDLDTFVTVRGVRHAN